MIHVRHASIGDANLLAEIGNETFSDTFAADNTPENMEAYLASAFSPEILAAELSNPASLFLIGEIDEESVGYAWLNIGTTPKVPGTHPIEIVRIYARKQWIGHGVGAALMQACLTEAVQQGCDVIWLGVWEKNLRAIRFYQKWGFKQVGIQIFQMGDDPQTDFVMQRPIQL